MQIFPYKSFKKGLIFGVLCLSLEATASLEGDLSLKNLDEHIKALQKRIEILERCVLSAQESMASPEEQAPLEEAQAEEPLDAPPPLQEEMQNEPSSPQLISEEPAETSPQAPKVSLQWPDVSPQLIADLKDIESKHHAYDRAHALFLKGEYKKAKELFETVSPKDSKYPNALIWLGTIHGLRKEHAKAASLFSKAYQSCEGKKNLKELSCSALLKLAKSLFLQHKTKQADVVLGRVTKEIKDLGNPPALVKKLKELEKERGANKA